MARRTKLKPKFVIRRIFLFFIVLAAVAGGLWYAGVFDRFVTTAPEEAESAGQDADSDSRGIEPTRLGDDEVLAEVLPQEPEPQPQGNDDDWNLLLVNLDNSLPAGFSVELETIYETPNNTYRVDARIADTALDMFTQARLDGISLFPCSAYRDVEYQQGLYDSKVEEYRAAGYNDEDAAVEAAAWVAVPGTSEHHTGLAIDIVTEEYQTLDDGFAATPAFRWLSENAHKYGFILRYPQDKVDVTRISYEPWHYRYVGVDHAYVIKESGLCLEEYLQLLAPGGSGQSNDESENENEDPNEGQGVAEPV